MKKLWPLAVGVFVTLLWSTSYFINQNVFAWGVGPFSLSGMRYLLAGLLMLTILNVRGRRAPGKTKRVKLRWKHLVILGVTGYFMAQGFQYAGQFFLTPTLTNLLINIGNTAFVLLLDAFWLHENRFLPSAIGLGMLSLGVVCYFYPFSLTGNDAVGILFVLLSSLGCAVTMLLNRSLRRDKGTTPGELIAVPMIIGGVLMLAAGFAAGERIPFSWELAGTVVWLAAVNGTLAFYLWTWSQKYLTSLESSLINSLMLIEIAWMDVLLTHRVLTALQWTGIACVMLALVAVQLFKRGTAPATPQI